MLQSGRADRRARRRITSSRNCPERGNRRGAGHGGDRAARSACGAAGSGPRATAEGRRPGYGGAGSEAARDGVQGAKAASGSGWNGACGISASRGVCTIAVPWMVPEDCNLAAGAADASGPIRRNVLPRGSSPRVKGFSARRIAMPPVPNPASPGQGCVKSQNTLAFNRLDAYAVIPGGVCASVSARLRQGA